MNSGRIDDIGPESLAVAALLDPRLANPFVEYPALPARMTIESAAAVGTASPFLVPRPRKLESIPLIGYYLPTAPVRLRDSRDAVTRTKHDLTPS